MRAVGAIAAVALSACGGAAVVTPPGHQTVSRIEAAAMFDGDGLAGARAAASAAFYGLGIGGDAAVVGERRDGDPAAHPAGVVDVFVNVSLFGLYADDHGFERFFDLGGELGAGGGILHPGHLTTVGEAWVGAWMELRIGPGDWSYPALRVAIEQTAVAGEWRDRTMFVVGLTWVSRSFSTDSGGYLVPVH